MIILNNNSVNQDLFESPYMRDLMDSFANKTNKKATQSNLNGTFGAKHSVGVILKYSKYL